MHQEVFEHLSGQTSFSNGLLRNLKLRISMRDGARHLPILLSGANLKVVHKLISNSRNVSRLSCLYLLKAQ